MNIEYIHSDRSTGFNDRGACSVNALATVADIPFLEAQALMAAAGRKHGRGVRMTTKWWTKVPKYRFAPVIRSTHTVGRFIKKFPTGRYVVRKKGHIFSIIDGRVFDWLPQPQGPRTRLTHAWKLEPRA